MSVHYTFHMDQKLCLEYSSVWSGIFKKVLYVRRYAFVAINKLCKTFLFHMDRSIGWNM